jgi:hypothetical protein
MNDDGARLVQDDSLESWIDANGGEISDSATRQLYYDDAQVNAIPDGKALPIRANSNLLSVYDSTGVQVKAKNVGKVRADKRIVNGVVDNGENYENWEFSGTGTGTDGESITLVDDGGSDSAKIYKSSIKASTFYTLVYDVISATTTNWAMFNTFSDTDISYPMTYGVGENRVLIETSSTITLNGFGFLISNGNINFKDFAVYEGDYTTGDLPTTGESVLGNTTISYDNPSIYREQVANAGLTNDGFDRTDPTSLVALPIAIPSNNTIDNDQQFTDTDPYQQLTYEQPLEEPCYTKANIYTNMVEVLTDSEGSPLIDSEGSKLYALIEGVERI